MSKAHVLWGADEGLEHIQYIEDNDSFISAMGFSHLFEVTHLTVCSMARCLLTKWQQKMFPFSETLPNGQNFINKVFQANNKTLF